MARKKEGNELWGQIFGNWLTGVAILALLVILVSGYFILSGGERIQKGNLSKEETGTLEENVLAKVDGEKVTEDEVIEVQQNAKMQGIELSKKEAIDQAIDMELITKKAIKEGHNVSREEAEKLLEERVSRQGQSIEAIKEQLEKQGQDYSDILEDYRDQIAVQEYLKEKMGQVPNVSKGEIEEYYEIVKEQAGNTNQSSNIPELNNETKNQIRRVIKNQKRKKVQENLIKNITSGLRENADIEYLNINNSK